jgi:hypothetical protein
MCEVMRAPFCPSGSLAIWTMISWPSFSRSLMEGGRRGGDSLYHSGRRWDIRHRRRFRRHGRRGYDRGRRHAVQLEDLILHAGDDLVVLFVVFEEIGDVQKCIAIQADVDKRRLHARQDSRHAAFMNTAGQRIFVLALVVDFDYLIVLENRHTRFVAVGRDH